MRQAAIFLSTPIKVRLLRLAKCRDPPSKSLLVRVVPKAQLLSAGVLRDFRTRCRSIGQD